MDVRDFGEILCGVTLSMDVQLRALLTTMHCELPLSCGVCCFSELRRHKSGRNVRAQGNQHSFAC